MKEKCNNCNKCIQEMNLLGNLHEANINNEDVICIPSYINNFILMKTYIKRKGFILMVL